MTTVGYFAKRAVIDRLTQFTGDGQALAGVQVEYASPAEFGEVCAYGGGITFDQPGDQDAVDGDDAAFLDTATFGLYVRIAGRSATVRETEERAETIGDQIGAILRKEPRMCGPNTNTSIVGGTGDYVNTDDGPIVVLAYRITTTAYLH